MDMKSTYRKYLPTIVIWAGCFIVFCLVYMLVLSPQKKIEKQMRQQLDEKKQMYESVLQVTQEETKLKLNRRLEQLKDELKAFVIDSESSANLTFDISQIANEKRVSSFGIKTQDKRRSSDIPNCSYIGENHIDVSFTAGFNQFATFLNALERHQPVIFVDKFRIIRSDENTSGHEVDMDLAVFVRKRQES